MSIIRKLSSIPRKTVIKNSTTQGKYHYSSSSKNSSSSDLNKIKFASLIGAGLGVCVGGTTKSYTTSRFENMIIFSIPGALLGGGLRALIISSPFVGYLALFVNGGILLETCRKEKILEFGS